MRPQRRWVRVTERVQRSTSRQPDVPVLTDDNAPVEQLISTLFTTGMGL
jgi:hypothetical protein